MNSIHNVYNSIFAASFDAKFHSEKNTAEAAAAATYISRYKHTNTLLQKIERNEIGTEEIQNQNLAFEIIINTASSSRSGAIFSLSFGVFDLAFAVGRLDGQHVCVNPKLTCISFSSTFYSNDATKY